MIGINNARKRASKRTASSPAEVSTLACIPEDTLASEMPCGDLSPMCHPSRSSECSRGSPGESIFGANVADRGSLSASMQLRWMQASQAHQSHTVTADQVRAAVNQSSTASQHVQGRNVPLLESIARQLTSAKLASFTAAIMRQADRRVLGSLYQIYRMMDHKYCGVLSVDEIAAGFDRLYGEGSAQRKFISEFFRAYGLKGSDTIKYAELCGQERMQHHMLQKPAVIPRQSFGPASAEVVTFSLTLRRLEGRPLGLVVHSDLATGGLVVEGVQPGSCAHAWNKQNAGELRELREGDRLVHVNNMRGAEVMRNEFVSQLILKMKVERVTNA